MIKANEHKKQANTKTNNQTNKQKKKKKREEQCPLFMPLSMV